MKSALTSKNRSEPTGRRIGRRMKYRDLTADESSLARGLLEASALEDQVHHFLRAMTPRDMDQWEEGARTQRLIGCFDGARLVGFAQIASGDHEAGGDDHAECSLFVDAAYRGRGIGTLLFQRTCDALRAEGARFLTILVTRGDADMLDLAARNHGLSVYRHGRSRILPDGDHPTARWLVFELDKIPAETWFKRTLRNLSEQLEL